MKSKSCGLRVAGSIFGLVALLHLLRLITCVNVTLGGCGLPLWVNIIGLIGALFLSIWLWWLSFRECCKKEEQA